jgi:very-short-patch-repair endonuclease
VGQLATRQHGVFTRGDAVSLGATKAMIATRLSTGRWERVSESVYRLAGAPTTWHQSLLAACMATAGIASHRAAGALHLLAAFVAGQIEVTVPRGRRPRPRGITVHQLHLPPVDVTVVDAIPTTTPARTVLDLASVCPADVVEEALDDALRRRLLTVSRLRWRLEQLGRRGGAATIRRLLDLRSGDGRASQSVLETRFLRLVRRSKLPSPERQYQIRERGRLLAVVDFAYPDVRLAIEADGYRWHSGRLRWQRDLERRNALTQLGWRIVHVTAHDIEQRPAEIVAAIREALR